MTKTETSSLIAAKLDLPETTVLRVLNAYHDHITEQLIDGHEVNLRGIVRLTPVKVPEMVFSHPQTHKKMSIKDYRTVKAVVFKSLRKKLIK